MTEKNPSALGIFPAPPAAPETTSQDTPMVTVTVSGANGGNPQRVKLTEKEYLTLLIYGNVWINNN